MIAVVQRVRAASVTVGAKTVAQIGPGAVVFLGVFRSDSHETAKTLAARVSTLRYFDDAAGRLNRSIVEAGGAFLVVSEFTLCGDTRKGTRPNFTRAAPGPEAQPLYEDFLSALRECGRPVHRGVFGARMTVRLENDGPVTLITQA